MNTTTAFTTREARLRAIAQRDVRADGAFVYGVRTTGVYCRPSCPSRRPLASNIAVFVAPAAAESAGFRACKRCRPQAAALADPIVAAVAAACLALERSDPAPGLQELAARAGYSPAHFHRAFHRLTGLTPKGYAKAAAARSAAPMHNADALHYTFASSPLGRLLVVAGRRGVRWIALGDSDDRLLADLRRAFPAATLVRDAEALAEAVARVMAFIDLPAKGLALPLCLRGTAFQHRVWNALQRIPPGSTISYKALAARLGSPEGARAVARACAANTLALAIPCHRVVASDGALTGYRWGVDRKRDLLGREALANTSPAGARRKHD
jgi:AraC family transcriptional regulator of adaptative response/methylated-DNA-[protein]-cysteine methyltransferase